MDHKIPDIALQMTCSKTAEDMLSFFPWINKGDMRYLYKYEQGAICFFYMHCLPMELIENGMK